MMSSDQTNLEVLTLIWLDKFGDATQENREIQDKLRSIINYLLVFDNRQSCEHYLQNPINDQEKIILIVSGQLGQEIIENIHSLRQIISIFVFCGNKPRNELWAKNYPKIRNVIVEIEDLLKEIEIDIHSEEQRFNQSIEFIENNNQILQLLGKIPSEIVDKRNFLKICFKFYENNPKEISNIEEFEHLYCSSDALKYLIHQKFLSRLLIKSLLQLNLEMLYLIRFYLQDIEEQLQLSPICSSKLYFGQLMKINQIEILNHFNDTTTFRFNSFILPNRNEEYILHALQNSPNTNGLHKVIFQIEISQLAKIYQNVIFFPINTHFRLISIKFEKRIWFVQINPIDFNHSMINENLNSIEFVHYCRNLGLLDQSENLFHLFLNEYPLLHYQSYDGLGRIAQDKGLYQQSLQYYLKSLEYVSTENRFHCLNNIGCAHDYLEEYDKALHYYFKSLSLITTDKDRSMVFNNIGITLAKTKQYEQAMKYFQDSFEIRKQIFSKQNYQIGISLTNMAIMYSSIEQFDKALQNFNLSLDYFQSNQLILFKGIVYFNLAQIFQIQNHFNKAIQFYQDSLHIYKQFKPIDHPNIIFIEQQIQLLKQNK